MEVDVHELQQAVQEQHGGTATFTESVPVFPSSFSVAYVGVEMTGKLELAPFSIS